MNWISVTDQLPPYGQKVLVWGEHRAMNPQMGGAYASITYRQDFTGTALEKTANRYLDKNQFTAMRYVTHWCEINPPK